MINFDIPAIDVAQGQTILTPDGSVGIVMLVSVGNPEDPNAPRIFTFVKPTVTGCVMLVANVDTLITVAPLTTMDAPLTPTFGPELPPEEPRRLRRIGAPLAPTKFVDAGPYPFYAG